MTIYTQEEIDKVVRNLTCCTWVKRRNLRRRMTSESNIEVSGLISEKRKEIRKMFGKSESEKRAYYAEITQLEKMILPC